MQGGGKVHELDRVGAIYEVKCKKHGNKYVGETERSLKSIELMNIE